MELWEGQMKGGEGGEEMEGKRKKRRGRKEERK